MTITIPDWVLWLPLWYVVLGVALTPVLLSWANRQVQIKGWYEGLGRPQSWLACGFLWPWLIWELYVTPRRNRKVIANWRLDREPYGD
jgi:hypothetical protein